MKKITFVTDGIADLGKGPEVLFPAGKTVELEDDSAFRWLRRGVAKTPEEIKADKAAEKAQKDARAEKVADSKRRAGEKADAEAKAEADAAAKADAEAKAEADAAAKADGKK